MKIIKKPVRLTQLAPLSRQQHGATLIVALVMLLLISLLAAGGMQGSILQERMASNAHDGAISFQASEAALRQGEDNLMTTLTTRQTAYNEGLMGGPWAWDGADPAPSGVGNAGSNVSAQPAYHLAYLADVCPIEPGPCFERYLTTSRGQGGSDEAVTVLQSTVLLAPE
ncbi:pilus assembly PilX family protein [Marinobacter sp. LV10MA510-1]|uniref:pilus assembly PilX family protein n=1 Tax=Marinobacter sp. LV10MA510-1 TaxID=1415567 RepID=UPI000BF6B0E9|nr:PilX N-terminal domain-containing pilus assembly protein [Marinobacter sp. LV10MA510-1]PFG09850.1 type IV pilus assembly protein PilX [Marinobacter sp. LV10MA510-1]